MVVTDASKSSKWLDEKRLLSVNNYYLAARILSASSMNSNQVPFEKSIPLLVLLKT